MKVLIAEDDAHVRFAMQRMLRTMGCETIEAPDGATALEVLAKTRVSLMILDIGMPVLSGLEVLQAVRSSNSGRLARLPVVLASGVGDEAVAARVIRLGVTDFLAKPIDYSKAKMRLERVLEAIGDPASEDAAGADTSMHSRPILVVDQDSQFRFFVANVLGSRFRISETASGVEAVTFCQNSRPAAIIVGEEIGLLGPELLVKNLRKHPHLADTRFALVKSPCGPAINVALFDATMERTFVPEQFATQFRKIYERFAIDAGTATSTIRQCIVPSVQQALGMMAHVDVSHVEGPLAIEAPYIEAALTMTVAKEDSAIVLTICAAQPDARRIASKFLQIDESEIAEEDYPSAVAELVNVIAGRLQGAVAAQGVNARFEVPDVKVRQERIDTLKSDGVWYFKDAEGSIAFLAAVRQRNAA